MRFRRYLVYISPARALLRWSMNVQTCSKFEIEEQSMSKIIIIHLTSKQIIHMIAVVLVNTILT